MVSVIMSVYNESREELSGAIESILNQTYPDFEFIIVCDNPNNIESIELIQHYERTDERVRLIKNEANIGLAMSLNRAAQEAKGEFLFRMDADDIAYTNRMLEEYQAISEENLDLVCSGYDIIDEKCEIVSTGVGYQKDVTMRSSIPYQVTIHHPTVMMRRSFFEAVGGYRNFICAQDYDLWLRMWYANARMKHINKPLLKYRMRGNSITSKKRFIQKLTTDYVKELFWQRLETGEDDYSYTNYNDYLVRLGAYDSRKKEKFLKEHSMLSRAKTMINQGCYFRGFLIRAKVFFVSDSYRRSYLGRIKTQRLVNVFLNKTTR